MKIFFVLIVIIFSSLFFACEDEIIPIPLPPSPPSASPTEENSESQAAPVEKLNEPARTVSNPAKEPKTAPAKEPKTAPAKEPKTASAKESKTAPAKESKTAPVKEPKTAPAKEPARTVAHSMQNEDIAQLRTGRYVIQVAVFPVEASAKKIIKKLSENGINAYSARVQNPDPEKGVIGTYYRVRIGFFDGRSIAETFAKARLEPLGYAWWVDRSKNDNVGSLAPEPIVKQTREQTWEQAEQVQAPPKHTSEQATRDAEKEAAIAAAKEQYRAIAKAANAAAAPPPAKQTIPPPKIPPPAKASAPAPVKKKPETKEAEIDPRGKVKMKK
jgi:cell division septation protein DedD